MNQTERGRAIVVTPVTETDIERREAMERFWRTAERIRERNADKDPDEEIGFITEEVEEIRRERHARAEAERGG